MSIASQIQEARLRLQHIMALSQQYCEDFPADAKARMANEFGCLQRLLTALSQGQQASPEDTTVCVLAGLSSQEMLQLWTVMEGFRQQLDKLQAEVQRLKADREILMLGQMGTQTMNKVTRYCVPSIKSPYAARFASMDSIQQHKQHDVERVKAISTKYPHLVTGVSTLCSSAFAIAHPKELEDAEGKFVSPNIVLLQELVDKTFRGSMVEGEVKEVLNCLEEMQEVLHEDVFVDTNKP